MSAFSNPPNNHPNIFTSNLFQNVQSIERKFMKKYAKRSQRNVKKFMKKYANRTKDEEVLPLWELKTKDDNYWKEKLQRTEKREQQKYRNWITDTFISSFFPDDQWKLYKRFKMYEAAKRKGGKDFSTDVIKNLVRKKI